MNEVKKKLKLKRMDYYIVHLSLVNCVLPVKLTPMEIEVMASFLALQGDITEDRFGASARKKVKKERNISSAGLSNYIRELKRKGFLIEKGATLTILPILFPQDKEQDYHFKLMNDDYTG